jgi:hypothetical protein
MLDSVGLSSPDTAAPPLYSSLPPAACRQFCIPLVSSLAISLLEFFTSWLSAWRFFQALGRPGCRMCWQLSRRARQRANLAPLLCCAPRAALVESLPSSRAPLFAYLCIAGAVCGDADFWEHSCPYPYRYCKV